MNFIGSEQIFKKYENNNITKINTNESVDIYHSYHYTPLGFEIEKIRLHCNCIVLCYYDYEVLKKMYEFLEHKTKYEFLEHKTNNQIRLRIIVTPFDEPNFKIVVEFINRNKDCYCVGYMPENILSDEDREKKFLSNITEFDKIIYIGDVIHLSEKKV